MIVKLADKLYLFICFYTEAQGPTTTEVPTSSVHSTNSSRFTVKTSTLQATSTLKAPNKTVVSGKKREQTAEQELVNGGLTGHEGRHSIFLLRSCSHIVWSVEQFLSRMM